MKRRSVLKLLGGLTVVPLIPKIADSRGMTGEAVYSKIVEYWQLPEHEPHHYVIVSKDEEVKLYIDGELKNINGGSFELSNNKVIIDLVNLSKIDSDYTYTYWSDGRAMNELAVFDRCLSVEDIKMLGDYG